MKITRLYSNKPEIFQPIEFNLGLSAVVAEIHAPDVRDIDTHNLGKTKLGELIDFCLLKQKSKSQFLFSVPTFDSFVFFIELELADGGFVTVARPVNPGSRVSILRTETSIPDAQVVPAEEWDQQGLAFERARKMLDGILGWGALSPWEFRKLVGYLIRTQQDYQDVFQLGKFSGKHQDWKPFVAHLLGLGSKEVRALYDQREVVEHLKGKLDTLVAEWGGHDDSASLDGLIALKKEALFSRSAALETFDFHEEDARVSESLVEEIEQRILHANEERYELQQLLARISSSLAERTITVKPKQVEALFAEVGVVLGEQLVRSFDELVAFNRAITAERRAALQDQAARAGDRFEALEAELLDLNSHRSRALAFLHESASLEKYKELSSEVSKLSSELAVLEARRESAARLINLRRAHREATEELGRLESEVEANLLEVSGDSSSRFARLRSYFNEVVSHVTGQSAILAARMNASGGLDFSAEFVGESGTATSGDQGTTYKKLLCIAFDLAMLRSFIDVPFARFVYHDGALEQLEPRKREKLLEVFRQYAEYGVQIVFSALDSDFPGPVSDSLAPNDIVIALHDEGDDGRLFKMPAW